MTADSLLERAVSRVYSALFGMAWLVGLFIIGVAAYAWVGFDAALLVAGLYALVATSKVWFRDEDTWTSATTWGLGIGCMVLWMPVVGTTGDGYRGLGVLLVGVALIFASSRLERDIDEVVEETTEQPPSTAEVS